MSQSHEFIRFAVESGVLKFGDFKTKAGRTSPYFFNAGLFNDGRSLGRLAAFYAERLLLAEQEIGTGPFDMLYGPAYKGIALASSMAVALAARGRNLPFAFNRKEAKDHGEGGNIIGAPLAGLVVIVDDVISAGTSVGESVTIIRAHGATPAAVLIALDRMERGGDAVNPSGLSAVQQVRETWGLPVHAIATLDDLLAYLDDPQQRDQSHTAHRTRIADYRSRFGT
ncbi:MAG TPA: orotate phosphoribosyltransferase [Reyranella sp.]|nr:orotate phosphoribosyltransferase [Reyranella sp.]